MTDKKKVNKRLSILLFVSIIIIGGIVLMFKYNILSKSGYDIKIKDGWFYVNGEKFLIKGIGYSGCRPHQLPWKDRIDPVLMEKDFKLIKDAGFNTIRTWSPLRKEELELAQKYGLLVIQGIWMESLQDYSSKEYISYLVENARVQAAKVSLEKNNIIMYLVGNEPPVEKVHAAGVRNTESLFRAMQRAVKKVVPATAISLANWPQLAFMDHSFWDAISFNIYMYKPVTIAHSLGYRGYIEWLKGFHAKDKPLVISEYGLSVSKTGPGEFGYGGNSLEQQTKGVLYMWDEIINANAQGGCLFEWNDEWWKNYEYPGDEKTHDNDPEEWFGIVAMKDSSRLEGELRPLYDAVKEYNRAIVVSPKDMQYYPDDVKVEVYTTDDVKRVDYRLNNETRWRRCRKTSAHWWKADLKSVVLEKGENIIEVRAIYSKDELTYIKQRRFWTLNKLENSNLLLPLKVEVSTDKLEYIEDTALTEVKIEIKVRDGDGNPVDGINVDYAIYEPRFSQEITGKKITDKNGLIKTSYFVQQLGFVTISAGVNVNNGNYKRKFGDIAFVQVKGKSTK